MVRKKKISGGIVKQTFGYLQISKLTIVLQFAKSIVVELASPHV